MPTVTFHKHEIGCCACTDELPSSTVRAGLVRYTYAEADLSTYHAIGQEPAQELRITRVHIVLIGVATLFAIGFVLTGNWLVGIAALISGFKDGKDFVSDFASSLH